MTCAKYCKVTQEGCTTPLVCDQSCVRHEPNQPIDMAPSWRDYVRMLDIVGAVLVVIFAGWASQFLPVVMGWVKTVFN